MQSLMAASRLGYGLLSKLTQGIRPNTDLSKRGGDLGRGPQALSKLPAAAWSNTWPAPAATLDLDFANNRGFVRGSGQGGAMDAVTFTRASSGNWVDNTGTLRTGAGTFAGTANALGNNFVSNPQNFENASWTKGANTTITANSGTAPDGTNTASIYNANTTADQGFYATVSGLSTTLNYTCSIYLKRINVNWIRIQIYDGSNGVRCWVNLSNLTLGASLLTIGTGSTAGLQSISDAGNGWVRVSFNSITPGTTKFFQINAVDGDASTTLVSGNTLVWGAQLEVGSSATTYYPTNINAPRFDWASTTVTPNVNLLSYTEQFNNAAWVKNNTTTVADTTTAPNGTLTADTLDFTSVGGGSNTTQTVSLQPVTHTFSVYLKPNSIDVFTLYFGTVNSSYAAQINLTTNTFSSIGASITGYSIVDAGSGWKRVSISAVATASSTVAIGKGPTIGSVYAWGAQVELGASATTYQPISFPTTNTPLVANATCNGLLIEESRTNRILWCRDGLNGGTAVGTNALTYSEQFQQSGSWSLIGLLAFGSGSTADATTAPNGTVTADLITEDTGSVGHGVQQLNAAIASTYTYSVYAKAASGTRYVQLRPYVSANNWGSVVFDLATATVTQSSKGSGANVAVLTGAITSVGSGWYRCSIVFTNAAVLNNVAVLMCASGTPTLNTSFGYDPYTGDGTSGIYIWGAQLTPSSVLTDYQVTTTAAFANYWSRFNVTAAKTATGIDGVANAATTITATASNAVLIQPISLASGSRTGSVYLKRISGTGNVQVTLDGTTWSTVDLSNGLWNRIVLSGTVTNATIGIRLATNGDAVAMDYAQVEDGAFVTSPILTTTATATRAVDAPSVGATYFTPLYNATQGTLAVQSTLYVRSTVNDTFFASFFNGDNNNRPLIQWSANNNLVSRINGASTFVFGNAAFSNNFKLAVSYGPQVQYAANNGTSYSQNVADFRFQTLPLRPTALTIGYYSGGGQFNNCIRRITYWPVQYMDAQLSDLTGVAT